MSKTLTHGFEFDGKTYRTDVATIRILRVVIPRANTAKDGSAVIAVMMYGQATGCIVEVAS